MRRLFAFGCSFTDYPWPTWAEIAGLSFDEFYNCGHCGAGNQLILGRILEADRRMQFTQDDVILVMWTSTPRLDMYNRGSWRLGGNLEHHCFYDEQWLEEYWSQDQGVYDSWKAITAAKQYLTSKGVEHKFMSAFDFDFKEEVYFRPNSAAEFLKDIRAVMDFPSEHTWAEERFGDKDYFHFSTDNHPDRHPSIKIHLAYLQEFMPHLIVSDIDRYINYWEGIVDFYSLKACKESFEQSNYHPTRRRIHWFL